MILKKYRTKCSIWKISKVKDILALLKRGQNCNVSYTQYLDSEIFWITPRSWLWRLTMVMKVTYKHEMVYTLVLIFPNVTPCSKNREQERKWRLSSAFQLSKVNGNRNVMKNLTKWTYLTFFRKKKTTTTPKICGIPASQNKQNRIFTPETLHTDVQCLHIECLFTQGKLTYENCNSIFS